VISILQQDGLNILNKDPYIILGIQRTATINEIKRRYRVLAMKEHPDKGGDIKKFLEIKEAYEILTNTKSKETKSFDQGTDTFFKKMFGSKFGPWSNKWL